MVCRFAGRKLDRSGRIRSAARFPFALLLLAPTGVAIAGEAGPPRHPFYPGIAIFALVLAATHLMAPTIRRLLSRIDFFIRPAGGGLAIGYVFYHLLPELDRANEYLGRRIFMVALLSFMTYYGLTSLLARRQFATAGKDTPHLFQLKLAQLCIYNWLIVYGIPGEVAESHARAVFIAVALGRHLLQTDYNLGLEHPEPLDRYGRYVLALAPIAGWLTVVVQQQTSEATNDVFVALLAGALLYNIFSEELPEPGKGGFVWFAGGAIFFVAFAWLALG